MPIHISGNNHVRFHLTKIFVSPEKLIAIVESRGLIYELGGWVIETAFRQLIDWLSVSDVPIKMAINLSAKQIEDKRFVYDLSLAVSKYGIGSSMLELEITESIAMEIHNNLSKPWTN
jgi:EAL domain-containing protein (putative c-di-GMP-specific phosphodiesterase class I)